MWTPPYKECEDKNWFDGSRDTCGSSNVTIILNLDGKKVGEIGDFVEKKWQYAKTKLFEFKFHDKSKIEFLLAAKIINGHDSNGKPNGYGAAIKFKSFKIDQCFSKCE